MPPVHRLLHITLDTTLSSAPWRGGRRLWGPGSRAPGCPIPHPSGRWGRLCEEPPLKYSTLLRQPLKGKEERDDEKPEAEGQGANPPLFGKGDAKPKP